ncbi:MAG: neutral trehalase, partial [Firmicutes bacterium]|nr:neutral trehalase [Bacillota bacterium]
MKKNFGTDNWGKNIPEPICDDFPEYYEFYKKTWEIAKTHIKEIDGMPQSPYMDEAFCDTQIWIWDSCFMSLFCKYAQEIFPGIETLNNFYEVLYNGKKLPKIIPTDKEPEWTGAIPGKPYEIKVHIADNPPLFAWAEYENALINGDIEYIKQLLYDKKVLQKHYDWIEGLRGATLPDGVLNPTCLIAEKSGYRWEGGRSGMDNTPRGRKTPHAEKARPNNPDLLWIDAICQQALSARLIAKMFAIIKDSDNETEWIKKFEEKKKIINSLYWDKSDNFYYDIDCKTGEFCKVMTIASYWALTAGVASREQAKYLTEHLLNSKCFGGFVPFVSLSRSDNDFKSNGAYWRGSVWLPTAYATLKGLVNYGFYEDAHILASKLLNHMYRTYREFNPHTIW